MLALPSVRSTKRNIRYQVNFLTNNTVKQRQVVMGSLNEPAHLATSFDTSDSFRHILGIIINNKDTTLQPHAQYDILWHKQKFVMEKA